MDLEEVLGTVIETKALAFANGEMLDSLNQTAADYENGSTPEKLTAEELVRVSDSITTVGWLVLERLNQIEDNLGELTDGAAQKN